MVPKSPNRIGLPVIEFEYTVAVAYTVFITGKLHHKSARLHQNSIIHVFFINYYFRHSWIFFGG